MEIQDALGCFIQICEAEPEEDRPMPYFLVQGKYERMVNLTTIELYKLLYRVMEQQKNKLLEESFKSNNHIYWLSQSAQVSRPIERSDSRLSQDWEFQTLEEDDTFGLF